MAILGAVAAAGAPTAVAHTVRTAAEPAAGAILAAGPSRVSATFNEELQPAFAAMTVVGSDGNLWSAGDPQVRGAIVGVALRPLGPAGGYTVNYRLTSADGHVVSGSWSFTVTVPGPGAPGPTAQEPDPDSRVPLWPFAIGTGLLITAAAAWGLRGRS